MKETIVKENSRKAMKYRGVECLNCGHPLDLSDRYCAYCGQINTTKRLTLKDFINEFALSVFTYDSRFRFTIKDLLFKPGTITRDYVEGKRLKYANPFRFFLSASISYFILLAVINFFTGKNSFGIDDHGIVHIKKNDNLETVDLAEVTDDIDMSGLQAIGTNELPKLEEVSNPQISKDTISTIISKDEKTYDTTPEDSLSKSFLKNIIDKGIVFYKFYDATGMTDAPEALDSLNYEQSRTNLMLYSKNKDLERIKDEPSKFIMFLASKTPFFLFFFAPIFALFFWLIYSKKKFNYMEHLVFIFHIFSWVFVILIISLIPDTIIGDEIIASLLLLLVGPFYFYKALRNFYRQKRGWTLIKFVFLNIIFYTGATFFAVVFFAITAFLF